MQLLNSASLPSSAKMDSSMRLRGPAASKSNGAQEYSNSFDDKKYEEKSSSRLGLLSWIIIFVLHAGIVTYVHVEFRRFPAPKTVQGSKPNEFVEERAREHLHRITGFGPRVVGSHANENLTANYILDQLHKIKKGASAVNKLDVETSTVTGTFSLLFLGEFSSYYENVRNIVAKLSPVGKDSGKNSLLVNCHYDSIVDSPGKYICLLKRCNFIL